MKKVRIGAGQGFYGDSFDGAVMNAKYGNLDYLAFDALAELTMAILAKNKFQHPELGYTRDIGLAMQALLPLMKKNKFKMLTNAGGLNPHAAKEVVLHVAKKMGIHDIKVAVVTGDDIKPRISELQDAALISPIWKLPNRSRRKLKRNCFLQMRISAQNR